MATLWFDEPEKDTSQEPFDFMKPKPKKNVPSAETTALLSSRVSGTFRNKTNDGKCNAKMCFKKLYKLVILFNINMKPTNLLLGNMLLL